MAAPANVRDPKVMDPYLNFKFIVSWDGKQVAAVSKVSALTRSTQVVSHREGGTPQGTRRLLGQSEYGPITLERGITFDAEFEQWANKVWYYPNTGKMGDEVDLANFRKDITISLCNQAGQTVMTWYVFSCWPSEYITLPELDANANAVAIESLTLQNEGWTRDDSVTQPSAPAAINQPSS
jgi:phage tail-like protein